MKNTLTDLNNYLFESLERLLDDEQSEENLQKEIKRSEAVTAVASAIIQNGELVVKSLKLLNDAGMDISKNALPLMLESKQ